MDDFQKDLSSTRSGEERSGWRPLRPLPQEPVSPRLRPRQLSLWAAKAVEEIRAELRPCLGFEMPKLLI